MSYGYCLGMALGWWQHHIHLGLVGAGNCFEQSMIFLHSVVGLIVSVLSISLGCCCLAVSYGQVVLMVTCAATWGCYWEVIYPTLPTGCSACHLLCWLPTVPHPAHAQLAGPSIVSCSGFASGLGPPMHVPPHFMHWAIQVGGTSPVCGPVVFIS